MSLVMCSCKRCGVTTGIPSSLSVGGHLFNLFLDFMSAGLWLPVHWLLWMTSKHCRCTCCGQLAKRMK